MSIRPVVTSSTRPVTRNPPRSSKLAFSAATSIATALWGFAMAKAFS
jgi:hypothetical protein